METHELLFELSHPIRYEILKLLVESPLRLTKIGKQVDANNPEVSRHLDRLKNAKIVAKNVDGYYSATTFGEMIFGLMPSLSFLAAHPDLFTMRDLSHLPPGFLCRLGELSNCKLFEGTTKNFYKLHEMSLKAKKRIRTVSNEGVSDMSDETMEEFHSIVNEVFVLHYIFSEDQLEDENLIMLVENSQEPEKYFRVIPEAPLFCTIIDDEVLIAFLDSSGKTDFSTILISKDPSALKWCEDLLDVLWGSGKLPSEYSQMDQAK